MGSLYSWHWHKDIEAERPRYTTFAQSSEREHDDLKAMQNRKTVVDGFAFSVLLNEDGAGRLELTKA